MQTETLIIERMKQPLAFGIVFQGRQRHFDDEHRIKQRFQESISGFDFAEIDIQRKQKLSVTLGFRDCNPSVLF
jgi:hypothetical protein